MKNGKTIGIIIIVIAVIVVAVIIGATNKEENQNKNTNATNNNGVSYVEEVENGVKLNTSSKLNEAKEVNGLKISNIQLTTKSGITTLLADVQNISGAKTDLKNISITLLDQDGKELTTIKGVVAAMDNEATTKLNVATTSDYINAYDFKVSVE